MTTSIGTVESMSGYCVSFDPTVGVGSLGANVPQTFARSDTWMNIDNNIRSKNDCTSFPMSNVSSQSSKVGPIHENYYVNETGRGEINPQNKSQLNLKGNEVWNNLSFVDQQKTTTRETTEYAYAGNAAQQGAAEQNRSQYTGYGEKRNGVRTGGADTYALRGATLVTNYTNGPSRQNLLADSEARLGTIDFGTFGSDENYNGPGTINQALPNAGKYQYQYILGKQTPNPNRLIGIDDRQTASYLVDQLKENPLSIYTTNPNNSIPGFDCYVQPDDFSPLVTTETTDSSESNDYKGMDYAVSVYPNYSNKEINPNAAFVYNKDIDQTTNSFISQAGRPNSTPTFSGKCYSGNPDFGWAKNGNVINSQKIQIGGTDEPDVDYGNLYTPIKMQQGMAQGENCPGKPLNEGNRALNFATSPQFITSNF